MTVELAGTSTTRVRLVVSDLDARSNTAPIECRPRVADARALSSLAPHHVAPDVCEELLIRWPDAPTWPALLSIAHSVEADELRAGQFVAHFTIVAEY